MADWCANLCMVQGIISLDGDWSRYSRAMMDWIPCMGMYSGYMLKVMLGTMGRILIGMLSLCLSLRVW